MSIPTRIHIMLKDGTVLRNKSLFTFSYGRDLRERSLWITALLDTYNDPDRRKHAPWMDDFVLIETDPYFHVFSRNDLGLGNVHIVDPSTVTSQTPVD